MSTDAQVAANRRNAQKSTGPRTPQGKARSSANALRHGGYGGRVDSITSEILGEDPEETQAIVNGILDALDPTNLLEFTAALSVATRTIGRLRVDRLVAPLIEGTQLRTAETYELQVARDNANWARQSLAALDIADGDGGDTLPWQNLEQGLRLHVYANDPLKSLKFRDADGTKRYARTAKEHQQVFLHTLDQLFVSRDEARQYLTGTLHDFQTALDEVTRQVRYVVADRMYEGFDRTTKLQDLNGRGVANELRTYQYIKQQFSCDPVGETSTDSDAWDVTHDHVEKEGTGGSEPQEPQAEMTLDEILAQPIPGIEG